MRRSRKARGIASLLRETLVAQWQARVEMFEFDIETFVAKMDRMGLKLTAVPLADGKYRLNRWRTMQAFEELSRSTDGSVER